MTDLSVVVVNWNTRELVLACLDSVRASLFEERPAPRAEVIVVDNGSSDGSADGVAERFPDVELIRLSANRGFAGGCNAALERARGDVVLLLNSDATLTREAVVRALELFAREPRVGAAGVQLVHPDGRLQNSIHAFPSAWTELAPRALLEALWPARYPSKRRPPRAPTDVEAVLGAALFVRRTAVEEVGPLDDGYFFFLEETDWCWRLRRAGWRVVHLPDARIVHLSGASSKRRDPAAARIEFHRSLYRFLRLHRGRGVATLAMAVRMLRAAGTILLLAPLALVSPRQRGRLGERWAVLAWHLRGCPASTGLRGSLPAVASDSLAREWAGGGAPGRGVPGRPDPADEARR